MHFYQGVKDCFIVDVQTGGWALSEWYRNEKSKWSSCVIFLNVRTRLNTILFVHLCYFCIFISHILSYVVSICVKNTIFYVCLFFIDFYEIRLKSGSSDDLRNAMYKSPLKLHLFGSDTESIHGDLSPKIWEAGDVRFCASFYQVS